MKRFARNLVRPIRYWTQAWLTKSPSSDSSLYVFKGRDRIRLQVVAPYLSGRGIEIGAGAHPQALPPEAETVLFDIRNRAELLQLFGSVPDIPVNPVDSIHEHFPNGAPFLIAHNVLEHAPDPIGILCTWHEHLIDGGVAVISLPDKNACPDKLRLEPPFSHLLYDYLFKRGAHAFESKEHSLSFNLGWIHEAPAEVKNLPRAASWLLSHLYERSADIHWHAFTQSLAEKTVIAAALFGGRRVELLAKADFTTTTPRTDGDVILVYRVHREPGRSVGFRYEIASELEGIRSALHRGLQRIGVVQANERQMSEVEPVEHYPEWIVPEDRPDVVELQPPFRRESGHCFVIAGLITPIRGDNASDPSRSRYVLMQDGKPLGPAHALHDDIRRHGNGRFSHWHQTLFFSTCDNSDPNGNGRHYQLRPA